MRRELATKVEVVLPPILVHIAISSSRERERERDF